MTDIQQDNATKLRALQDAFGQQLPQRLADIQVAWDGFRAAPEDTRGHAELQRLVHSLAGSAGTFGYHQLGERVRELELQLEPLKAGASAEALAAIAPIFDALHAFADSTPDAPRQAAARPAEQPQVEAREKRVYLVEDDAQLGAEVARQLGNFGYQVEAFIDTATAAKACEAHSPDVLIIDMQLREGALEGAHFAQRHCLSQAHSTPAIFISAHSSWEARLAAVRAGGRAYLAKPLDFTSLVDQLDRICGQDEQEPYRILVVDDSELLAQHYATVLQSAGMQVEVLNDAAQVLNVIPNFKPELILMDLYMPGCSGIEVAQVIRQFPAYTNIPIVYLSTETALGQQLEAMRVGGDEFLKKPISDGHLITSVGTRVERFRSLRDLMGRDSLTGLLNHISLKLALESELERAHRSHSITSFAMIDIDHFKLVNDRYSHPVGDSVIKSLSRLLTQRLRKSDLIGRYGGEEFAVILRDTDLGQARTLIEALRKHFEAIEHIHGDANFTVSFSAGIATAPPHHGMEALINAADQALYVAKYGGRNQVVADPHVSDLERGPATGNTQPGKDTSDQ